MQAGGSRVWWLALLLGCASCFYRPLNGDYAGPKPLPAATAARYAYEQGPVIYTSTRLEEKHDYVVERVEMPAARPVEPVRQTSVSQETIVMDYYRPKGAGRTPVILCLPILGGDNRETEFFSRYFATRGYAALMVHRDQQQKLSVTPELLEPFLRQIVLDHRRAIDWVATQDNLDAGRIGVFGASMGGIKATLLTALDPRVRASVFALAGGDLPYILTHSSEKAIIRKVEAEKKKRNLSTGELHALLEAEVKTDPLSVAEYVDARRVQMILGVFDTVVPYRTGSELSTAIGGPEMILLPAGHYSSVLFITYVRSAAFEFFERKFAERPDGSREP